MISRGHFDPPAYQFDASQPIGFCIYCGETNAKLLSDEHIAPEALQGVNILRKASCRRCALLTSYSELRTLRGPLWAVREQFQIYGERRNDDRPSMLPLEILRKDWSIEKLMIPVAEYPLVFRMPLFPAPRFLQPPHHDDADFLRKHDYRQVDTADGVRRLKAILQADAFREKAVLDMEVFELSKVVAKIAYCFAIHFLGPYSIRPFVTDIIIAPRGQAPSFLHFVGGAFIAADRLEHLTTSDVGKCVIRTEPHGNVSIVLARVQLLGLFRGPVYEVVVGELLPPRNMKQIQVPTPQLPSKTYRELQSESLTLVMSVGG